MKCLIDGKEVSRELLARRGPTNFGQSFPSAAAPVPYQIVLSTQELCQQFGPVYELAVKEDRADAPFHERGDVPTLDRWQELGYPPLEELLVRDPRVFEEVVKDSLSQEILDQVIPGPKTGLPRYLVNSMDRVTVERGTICLEGQAFLHPALAGV